MSELVDKIYDVAAIDKQKQQVKEGLDEVGAEILKLNDLIKKLQADTRASKSGEDLAKNAKLINDAMVQGSEATKKYQSELDKLKAKTEQLTGAEKAANIEIAKARLELQAAQKDVKAAAVAEIEAAAATGKLNDSYNALDKELKKAKAAYREMTSEERKASGDELLKKIQQLDKDLKEADASMGQFNRNVGDYEGAIGRAGKSSVSMSEGIDMVGKGAASTAKGFIGMAKSALAFIATPIGAVIAAIAVVIGTLVKAFSRSEESMAKLKQVTGALSGIFGGFMNVLKPVVAFIADTVLKAFEGLGNVAEKATGLVSKGLKLLGFDKAAENVEKFTASVKENAKAGQDLAKMQADQIVRERELSRIQFEYLKEQEKFRQVRDDVSLSTEQRIKANDALGASLLKQAKVEMEIFQQAQKIAEANIKVNGETAENLDKLAEAKANIADLEERINGFQSEQLVNAVGLRKEAADLAKAQAQLITDAQRRLTDAKIAAMAEGEEKAIALANENLKRQLEDLKANGQLTAELQKNLEEINAKEVQKIRDEAAKTKADKDAEEFDKQLAAFEKNLQREVAALDAAYNERQSTVKRLYSEGLISKEDYEKQIAEIELDAITDANNRSIELLQKELEIANISADKKIEISDKLRELQITNENAVLDATIEANDQKIESDKAAAEKRKEIAQQIFDAGIELFNSIGDFQAQQSEQRLTEIEAEQTASDGYFASRQENLEKAIMSEESRAAAQKKIDEDKAKRDAEIAEKARAEKLKQAKWEKAQSLISAIVGTATATVGALGAQPWTPINFVLAALAAAAGAVQIATIASQKIPAFKDGGITSGGDVLWGEARPEVAVTKTGEVYFAERPTISKFDAGTRIFKSVEEFERNMSSSNTAPVFEIDYEEMGQHMPVSTMSINENGLINIIDRQGNRRAMINRRYYLG